MKTPERPLPPFYFMTGLILMIAVHFLLPVSQFVGSPWRYIGVGPVVIGMVLNLWADGLFKKYGTEVKPFRDSRGLVLNGPYRFSRNPMYLGGGFIFTGVGLLLGSALPLAVIPIMIWLVSVQFIVPEERDMERQFGDQYLEYRRRVRRWL